MKKRHILTAALGLILETLQADASNYWQTAKEYWKQAKSNASAFLNPYQSMTPEAQEQALHTTYGIVPENYWMESPHRQQAEDIITSRYNGSRDPSVPRPTILRIHDPEGRKAEDEHLEAQRREINQWKTQEAIERLNNLRDLREAKKNLRNAQNQMYAKKLNWLRDISGFEPPPSQELIEYSRALEHSRDAKTAEQAWKSENRREFLERFKGLPSYLRYQNPDYSLYGQQ